MNLSDREIEYIITLTRSEKPIKRIREYVQSLETHNDNNTRQQDFLHKMYRSFFSHYFRSFAGRYTEECISEAYVYALEVLSRGRAFDIALNDGIKAGSKLYRDYTHDVTSDMQQR